MRFLRFFKKKKPVEHDYQEQTISEIGELLDKTNYRVNILERLINENSFSRIMIVQKKDEKDGCRSCNDGICG